MPDILFKCSSCSQALAVDGEAAGTSIGCSACGAQVVVPAPAVQTRADRVPPIIGLPVSAVREVDDCPCFGSITTGGS